MNNTKILEEYFVWEEKNLIEPKMKLENNGVNEEVISTIKTRFDLTRKDWKDITDPKLRRKMRLNEKNKRYRERHKEKETVRKKLWYDNNKTRVKTKRKAYYETNKDKAQIYRDLNKDKIKNYFDVNKDKIYEQRKFKKENNIQYKLSINLRCRLHSAINGNYKSGSAVKDLGCTIDELKVYLESKFQPGMSWDNYGKTGWHIDHIKPLASFDLTDKYQLLEACNYTNLQPLWAKDNLVKSDNLI